MRIFTTISNWFFPTPTVEEVRTILGKYFKLTVTTDCRIRIKIPSQATSEERAIFIARCTKLCTYFCKNPYTTTLRGRSKDATSTLAMVSGRRYLPVFYLTATKVYKKEQP